MFTTDTARTVAAVVCTIVFSATAVISAVGPAARPALVTAATLSA